MALPGLIEKLQDGIIDESSFRKCSRKTLFILREVDGWEGGDLRKMLKDGPKYQMWHTISRWSAGIINDFPDYDSINNIHVMRESIQKIAAINLKKTSGGSFHNSSIVNAYCHMDRKLLREQINLIRPNYIICCGTFEQVTWLLDLELDVDNPTQGSSMHSGTDSFVISWRHPSRANNVETYSQMRNVFMQLSYK